MSRFQLICIVFITDSFCCVTIEVLDFPKVEWHVKIVSYRRTSTTYNSKMNCERKVAEFHKIIIILKLIEFSFNFKTIKIEFYNKENALVNKWNENQIQTMISHLNRTVTVEKNEKLKDKYNNVFLFKYPHEPADEYKKKWIKVFKKLHR